MEKIFDLGVQSYVAAAPQKRFDIFDIVAIVAGALVDIVKFSVLSIPYWIEAFVYLFVPRPKKNVAGQVALVIPNT